MMGGRARAYGANKRRKEVARKAKQDEKRRRRLERGKAGPEPEGLAPEGPASEGGPPIAEGPEAIA
ncbi:MAG: hypothetical protein ACREKA_11980 [Candidatus Methylomirabilales bacterium]